MQTVLLPLLATLAGLFRSRALLHLEILALRQQLATLATRDRRRPRTRHHERLFWIWRYRIWPGCLKTLSLVKPDTLTQLRGFALDFGKGEKVFPCESMPGLWISPENPL